MIRLHLRNFFIVEICTFITMRFYFGFQNTFVIDRLAIKLFFYTGTDFIFNQKIHPFKFSVKTFHICTSFWEHYMLRFNFMIIIWITKKVFIDFLTRKKIVRYRYFLNIYIFYEIGIWRWSLLFSILVSPNVLYLFFTCDKKIYALYFSAFFSQIDILANSANSTAIISNV